MNAYLETAKQRFDALPANDRRALLIMLAAVGLLVIYLSFSFTQDYQQAALARYHAAQQDRDWMEINQPQISNLASLKASASKENASNPESSLINHATTSAKPFGISFKRFQPQDENGLRLWIEGVEFDQLMRWLAALDQQHIRLDQIEVNRQQQQPGIADARVLLSSGQ